MPAPAQRSHRRTRSPACGPGAVSRLLAFWLITHVTTLANATPRIVCEPDELDFGTAVNTGSLERVFKVWNRGDTRLKIKRVIGCCGAKTHLASRKIAPGTNTDFKVVLSLAGRRGAFRKAIHLVSNDPSNRHCGIRIKGRVRDVTAQKSPGHGETGPRTIKPNSERSDRPVIIDYFFEAGCSECRRVDQHVLPELRTTFGGAYKLRRWDLFEKTNVVRLVRYQESLDIENNESVCMVFDYQHCLGGFDSIEERAIPVLRRCIRAREDPEWKPRPIIVDRIEKPDASILVDRASEFALAGVMVAGLVDGINPCAIGTLVFLVSILVVSGMAARRIVILGTAYCIASFLTYTAIGIGLLRVLHAFKGFPVVRTAFEHVLAFALLVLAVVSVLDAIRYARTGSEQAVKLKLPRRLRMFLHKWIRTARNTQSGSAGYTGMFRSSAFGFALGAGVTALESVCTGQVYLPTLAAVARQCDVHAAGAWALLLVYNAMFILPLVLAFILVARGLRTDAFVAFSRNNVVLSKCLIAMVFLALICLLLLGPNY